MKHASSRQKSHKRTREDSEEEDQRKMQLIEQMENDMNIFADQEYDLSKYKQTSTSNAKLNDSQQQSLVYDKMFQHTQQQFSTSQNELEKQLLCLKLSYVVFLQTLKQDNEYLKEDVEQQIKKIEQLINLSVNNEGKSFYRQTVTSQQTYKPFNDYEEAYEQEEEYENEFLDGQEEFGEEEFPEMSQSLESISQHQKRIQHLIDLDDIPGVTDNQRQVGAVGLETSRKLGQITGVYNVSGKEFAPLPASVDTSKKLNPEQLSSYLEEKAAERRKQAVQRRVNQLQSGEMDENMNKNISNARKMKNEDLDISSSKIKNDKLQATKQENIQSVRSVHHWKPKRVDEDQEAGARPVPRNILKNRGDMDKYRSRISRMKLRSQYAQHQHEKSNIFKKNKEQLINYQGQNFIDDRPIQKKDKK